MSKKNKNAFKRLAQRVRKLPFKVRLILAAVIAAAVVSVVIIVLLGIVNRSPVGDIDSDITADQIADRNKRVKQAQRDGAVRSSAFDAIQSGDTVKASQVYSEAISAESDVARKVQLSVEHSRLLYSAGKTEEAIKVAKTAETMTSDKFVVADWLGRVYEDQKKYSEAVQYYTLAGQSVGSPNNTLGFDKKHYDVQVARVTALGKQ